MSVRPGQGFSGETFTSRLLFCLVTYIFIEIYTGTKIEPEKMYQAQNLVVLLLIELTLTPSQL